MLAAYRILLFDRFPWIRLQLLDTQRHLALFAVQCQDYSLYFVAHLHEVLSRTQVLAPRHFRYVDQTFYTRSDFDECTVVGHNDHFALHVVAHLEVRVEGIPRMRSELLQTQSDTLLLVVEVEDNDVQLLVELYYFVRIAYAAPRQVGDVDQTVYATQVDEHTVGCDILDNTLEYLTLLEFADDFLLLLFQLSLDEGLVGNNDVLEFLVDLDNLEFHGLANEYIIVADRLHVDLRTRQEGFDAEYVYDHTTLCAALDVTLDDFLIFQSSVDAVPRTGCTGFAVRQNQLSFLVLLVFDVYFYRITYLQVGIVTEFTHRNDTV